MARLKQFVLFCSTGDVNYSEPGDTIRLWLDGDEILSHNRVSPPVKGQTCTCAYRVDLEYQEFLKKTVTLNIDGYGPWAGRDLFLVGELETNGYSRWLPLAHDLGRPHAPKWITQSDHRQMAILNAADTQQALHNLIVTMSVGLADGEHHQANVSAVGKSIQMSAFKGDDANRTVLFQENWPIVCDEGTGSNTIHLLHYPIPSDVPTTAEELSGVQLSMDPVCPWEHHVIQVFGVNLATSSGRLLGSSGNVYVATKQQSERTSTAEVVTIEIPALTTPVRSVSARNRRSRDLHGSRIPSNKGRLRKW